MTTLDDVNHPHPYPHPEGEGTRGGPANASPAPAVSVLLPVFNGQRYLRAAVDSVLGQSFTDFEVIAIDDGSTDSTAAILQQYAARDARVRVVSRANRGLVSTLNESIDLARAPLLARMDADDLCRPDRFAKQVGYLEHHPNCVLVGARVLLIDPEGLPIRENCLEQTHVQIDAAHLSCGWPVVHPAVMMRTAAVRAIGGYRQQYNTLEDLDLFLRLAEVGELANLPEVLLEYRQHFASVTHSKSVQQAQLRQAIFDETGARRGLAVTPKAPPPRATAKTRDQVHHDWAWSALHNGHRRTARKHALASVWQAPFSTYAWHLLGCAIRGR